MKNTTEREYIVLYPEGRIDSSNAAQTEQEMFEILEANPEKTPLIDASALDYISSAGLRVLMKLQKRVKEKYTVREVSPAVYDILETTGFTEILDVRKKFREISLDGCEVIGRGFYGTVYRLDEDTIVKMYNTPDALAMIENEKRMAKLAFIKGIPTAISFDIIKSGDRFGSVFELLRAKTFNDLVIERPEQTEALVRDYVGFIKSVHATLMDEGTLPSARERFLSYLDELKDWLSEEQIARCRTLLLTVPEDLHVIHGDFQMKNVMIVDDEPMLIDMDTLATGHPIFDLSGLYATYMAFEEDDPENGINFLGIDNDKCALIWKKILEYYTEGAADAEREETEVKIRIASYIRFLFILAVSDLKSGELGEKRIKTATRHLGELIHKTDSLYF
ncbi:MAG: phosphotransferase [Lachnospiraceae bacterium]|nr:phosphotransferase [Lachnospiraceae bacterium]